MWRILSLLPDSLTEWVALALVAGMAFLAGYGRGADDARQECETRIAVMEKDRARQEQARAEAMAAAEKSARERLAAATARGDRLALEVAQKTKELDAERASVNRRLAHVAETARRDCAGLTAPSALPEPVPVVAPKADAPVPATLLMLPAPPEPLAPGYGRTH